MVLVCRSISSVVCKLAWSLPRALKRTKKLFSSFTWVIVLLYCMTNGSPAICPHQNKRGFEYLISMMILPAHCVKDSFFDSPLQQVGVTTLLRAFFWLDQEVIYKKPTATWAATGCPDAIVHWTGLPSYPMKKIRLCGSEADLPKNYNHKPLTLDTHTKV